MDRRGQSDVVASHWVPSVCEIEDQVSVELTFQSVVKAVIMHSVSPPKTRRMGWGLEGRRNIGHWTSRILCFRFPYGNSTIPGRSIVESPRTSVVR